MQRERSAQSNDLSRAERALIRAAMGVVNAEGWAFQMDATGANVAIFPNAMRRLEHAIQRVRDTRKLIARAKRRKHG